MSLVIISIVTTLASTGGNPEGLLFGIDTAVILGLLMSSPSWETDGVMRPGPDGCEFSKLSENRVD
jgi:hypothetical protein